LNCLRLALVFEPLNDIYYQLFPSWYLFTIGHSELIALEDGASIFRQLCFHRLTSPVALTTSANLKHTNLYSALSSKDRYR